MDRFLRESVKNGKNINELLDMPYSFFLDILNEETKPQKANSFFELLG